MKGSVHFVKLESKKSTAAWETEEKVFLTREKVMCLWAEALCLLGDNCCFDDYLLGNS